MSDSRLRYIDIAAGVLLLYMMVEHIQVWFAGYYNPIFNYKNILSFYMPFFFFKSGMLTKAIWSKEKIIRDAKRLLIPFVITGVVCYVLMQIWNIQCGTFTLRHALLHPIKETFITGSFLVDNPTWFLLSLFIVKYVGDCAIRWSEKLSSLWIIIAIALGSMLGAYLHSKFHGAYCPQLVGNVMSGLTFYLVGYLFKNQYNNKWIIIMAILAYVVCVFLPYPYVVMHWNMLAVGKYLLWYPASLFGVIALLGVCEWGSKYYSFPILNWIGGGSAMFLLCAHWPFLLLFGKIFLIGVLGIENTMLLFILDLVACIVCLPLLKWGWEKWGVKV